MASSHQKGNDHSMFISESPHFFKVILRETLRDGKLGIPRKFMEKYGNRMSSPAVLTVPSGEVWKVELVKCDGKFWLKNGWQEFSNHYSLEHGHFLVFRYEGNCNFHVVILDRSASEIEYPYTSNNHGQPRALPQQEIKESEDDEPIQILEEIPPSRKRREKLHLPCPRPCKMTRSTNSSHKTKSILKSESLAAPLRHKECPDRKVDKSTRSPRICKLKADKKAKALQRAGAFKSENPFFLVVIQPSYVGYCAKLAIPRYFVRKHLMKDDCEVILYNSNGKTWTVWFHLGQTRKYGSLQTGWETFVQDNNIQVHDVCVFEVINCIEISFNVVIYPGQATNYDQPSPDAFGPVEMNVGGSSRSQDSWKSLNKLEKDEALQLASDFGSENPSFAVALQPSYVHSKLNIPENFARKYFTNMHNEVIHLLSNGKSWPVTYYQHDLERPTAKLSIGWRKFAVDNNLEVGDACVFELTKGAEASLKVTIYRKQAVEDANLGSSLFADESRPNQAECKEILVINAESNSVHHKAAMSSPNNQHAIQELPLPKIKENMRDAARETLDDISLYQKTQEDKAALDDILLSQKTQEDKAACASEEASQRHPTLEHIVAIQGTDRQD